MNSLQKLKAKAFQNEAVKAEYDSLAEEFEAIDQRLTLCADVELTQKEINED